MTELQTHPEHRLRQTAWLRGLARALVRDPHDTGDLTQDAPRAALSGGPTPPGRLRGWLGAVSRDLAAGADLPSGVDERGIEMRTTEATPFCAGQRTSSRIGKRSVEPSEMSVAARLLTAPIARVGSRERKTVTRWY